MHSTGCAATLAGSAQALDRWSGPADPIAFCHAVTALAAVRLVLPELLPDLARASVITSSATVGGIVATFAVPRRPDEAQAAAEGPAPDEVMARGIEDGDEHAITLAEAATRELARTADPTLLVAADRGPAAPAHRTCDSALLGVGSRQAGGYRIRRVSVERVSGVVIAAGGAGRRGVGRSPAHHSWLGRIRARVSAMVKNLPLLLNEHWCRTGTQHRRRCCR